MTIYVFLILAALLFAVFVVTLVMNGVMKRKGFSVKPILNVALMIAVTAALFFFFGGLNIKTVKGAVFALVLLYAAVQDYYSRECDDAVWVVLLVLCLVGFDTNNIISMLLGGAAIFVPQIVVVMFSKRAPIGGADIKISTAAGILLGFWRGVAGFAIGLVAAVITMTIITKVKKKDKCEPFPLMPFLSAGLMLGYFI